MTTKPKRATKAAVPTPTAALTPKREPTERELATGREAGERLRARRKRVQVVGDPANPEQAGAPHNDESLFADALLDTFGTTSSDFISPLVRQLFEAMHRKGGNIIAELNAGLAIVAGVQPENETEAMLAVQMAATHNAAMTMLAAAQQQGTQVSIEVAGNFAVKLLRTYTAQIEALAKLRRKGEQTVRVEHVHVHSGGQAIVGHVNHSPGGGGGEPGNSNQPHTADNPRALAFAPGAPLLCPDAVGEPVPVASGEREVSVPNARRRGRKRSS
jgi:hypothetical protein